MPPTAPTAQSLGRCLSSWLLAALAVTVAAASSGPATGGVPQVVVQTATLLRDDGKGNPGEQVDAFRPTDRRQHFRVELERLKVGRLRARWVFTAVETSAGTNVRVAEFDVTRLVGNVLSGNVSLPRDWPIGYYKAEVFLNDELIKSIEYTVTIPVSEISLGRATLRRDDGEGRPGAVVTSFRPSDRRLHFEVEGDGLFAEGTRVHWTFLSVDSAGGKNVLIAEVPEVIGKRGGAVLTATISLARDWPIGSYSANIHVGDRLVRTLTFEVR